MKKLLFTLFIFLPSLVYAQTISSFEQSITKAKAMSNVDTAIQILEQLVIEAKQKGYLDTVALTYHTIGLKAYQNQDSKRAISSTIKAVDIRTQLKDTMGISWSCFNVARFYMLMSEDLFAAIPYFQQIVDLGPDEKNTNFFNSLIYLIELERDRGDYIRSIQYGELGLKELEAILKPENEITKSQFLYMLASVYNELEGKGNLQKSLKYANAAIEILRQQDTPHDLANCYLEVGNTHSALNVPDSAIKAYQNAFQIFYEYEYFDEAVKALNNMSGEYLLLGQAEAAKAALTRGLGIRNELYGTGYDYRKAIIHNSLGEIYVHQSDLVKATKSYQEALFHLMPNLKNKNQNGLPDEAQMREFPQKQDLLFFLEDLAKTHFAFYQKDQQREKLSKALHTIEKCDFLIDLIRFEQTIEESKLAWRNKVHSIYETALSIASELNDTEKAFYFMEKSKSILLLEGLLAADARSIIPDSLANEEKELIKSILKLKEDITGNLDNATTRKELLVSQTKLDELIATLSKTHPQYHSIKYESQVISLEDAKHVLGINDNTTISYFVGDENIYALGFSLGKDAFLRIPFDSTLKEAINGFLAQFKSEKVILNNPKPYVQYAYEVYKTLIAPLLEQINTEATKLTLILDGNLQYIPFEALLDEAIESPILLDKLPYFINRFVMGYAYSATILVKQQKSISKKGATILGMAPFANINGNKGKLSYSEDELSMIKSNIKGSYYLDDSADLQRFLNESGNFSIIHLSTHATADNKEGVPKIYFNDKELLLSDLYALELPVDLVVLSACETSIGEVEKGEGLMSLARGFTYTGSKSLISSLWKVNDRSTAILFQSFYQNLLQGYSKTKALHKSKLSYLSENIPTFQKSPYYWASLIHIGDDQMLELAKHNSISWDYTIIAITIVIALIALFIFNLRR